MSWANPIDGHTTDISRTPAFLRSYGARRPVSPQPAAVDARSDGDAILHTAELRIWAARGGPGDDVTSMHRLVVKCSLGGTPAEARLTPANVAGQLRDQTSRLAMIVFSQRLLEECASDLQLPGRLQALDGVQSTRLYLTVQTMLNAFADTGCASAPLILARAAIRLAAIMAGARQLRKNDASLNPSALLRVVALVERDVGKDLRMAVLAREAGLGGSAFLRAFRGSLGITPGEFVIRSRIARAAEELRATGSPVADIARSCGFGSPAHLANTFRRRMGVSPIAFRVMTSRDMSVRQINGRSGGSMRPPNSAAEATPVTAPDPHSRSYQRPVQAGCMIDQRSHPRT